MAYRNPGDFAIAHGRGPMLKKAQGFAAWAAVGLWGAWAAAAFAQAGSASA